MVVDEVQHLDVAAVGQRPVGGVGLPALVGQLGAETYIGAPGPFLGLGDDKTSPGQHPPDARHRRDQLAGAAFTPGHQVVLDSVRPGVQALFGQ
jgi:hypothetical protein